MNQIDELISRASQRITSLEEFLNLVRDCLYPLEDMDFAPVTSSHYRNYTLPVSPESGRYLRPINQDLFVHDIDELNSYQTEFSRLVERLRETRGNLTYFDQELRQFIKEGLIAKVLYTTLQAIGCTLDISTNLQAARKNFGQRFEDFIKVLLDGIGIVNDSFTFKIKVPPIDVFYRVQLDLIMNPGGTTFSSNSHIDNRDTILSIKTSSKDRMKLIFIDRFVLSRILN